MVTLCPGCNDPNQECNLHHVTGTTVQSSTGTGRRVQATKSEAHTTTSGRPSGGHNRSSHKRMLQHRIHENNNQVCVFIVSKKTSYPNISELEFCSKFCHLWEIESCYQYNLLFFETTQNHLTDHEKYEYVTFFSAEKF